MIGWWSVNCEGRRSRMMEFHYEGERIWGATAYMLLGVQRICYKTINYESDIEKLLEVMRAPAGPGDRLPLGRGAGFLDDRAVHDRGGLRGGRCDRAGGFRRTARGTRATCCSRWCSMPRWRPRRAISISMTWRGGIYGQDDPARTRMCLALMKNGQPARSTAAGRRSRSRSGPCDGDSSALAASRKALPALKRAQKLGKRAARVGFDWPDTRGRQEQNPRGTGGT